ncbi:LysE family transporter [Amycolatopsis sp. NPDC051061]|uniref:LysE family translocator n=1 Tax=Amycolatopsis sp. NPDC051061 TaxID=3155042 RepID=UPI00341BFB34
MKVEGILGLIGFALVASITPGGATAFATASGAHFGLRRSVPVFGGIAAAMAVMAAASAAGLGGLLRAVPLLQLALKVLGTVYLLWLAVRTARSGSPRTSERGGQPIGFWGGVVLLLYNPKAWAMTAAAAASFASLVAGPGSLAALFGTVFAIAASVSLLVWCLLGVVLGRLLTTPLQWRVLNVILALLLVASVVPIWLEG